MSSTKHFLFFIFSFLIVLHESCIVAMETDFAQQLMLNVHDITLNMQNNDSINNNKLIIELNNNIEDFYQEPLKEFIAKIESKYIKYINDNKEVGAVHQLKDDLKTYLFSCAQSNSCGAKKWHSFFAVLSNKDSDTISIDSKDNDEFPQRIFELLQKKHENTSHNQSKPLASTVSKISMAIKIVENCPGLSQAILWGTKDDNQMIKSLLSLCCAEQTCKDITTQYFPLIQEICTKNDCGTIAQILDNFLNTPVIQETIAITCTMLDSKDQYNRLQKRTLVTLLEIVSSAYEEAKSMPKKLIVEDSTDESPSESFYAVSCEEDEFYSMSYEEIVDNDISESNSSEREVLNNNNSISDEEIVDNVISESHSNESKVLNDDDSISENPAPVKKSSLISQIFYRLGDIITKNKRILFISIPCLAIVYIAHKIGINNLMIKI